MSVERQSSRKPARLIALLTLVLLFVSLIVYSALVVRHPAGDKMLGEPTVTLLTLTDNIERGPDGGLVATADAASIKPGKACPT